MAQPRTTATLSCYRLHLLATLLADREGVILPVLEKLGVSDDATRRQAP